MSVILQFIFHFSSSAVLSISIFCMDSSSTFCFATSLSSVIITITQILVCLGVGTDSRQHNTIKSEIRGHPVFDNCELRASGAVCGFYVPGLHSCI